METFPIENDEEYDDLVLYIRTAVDKIIHEKFTWKAIDHTLDASYISSRLMDILKKSMNSEREQYLNQLLLQLSNLSQERESMEKELAIIRGSTAKETLKYQQDNIALKNKFASLEAELKNLETRQNQKEQFYLSKIKAKRQELTNLQLIISQTKSFQNNLTEEINALRSSVLQMQRKQLRMIQQAKNICKTEIDHQIESEIEKQNSIEMSTKKELESRLNAARLEEKKAERLCQSLLDAVWTMRSGKEHPNITAANFPDRIDEVCAYIDTAIEEQEQTTIQELKMQVQSALPDIEFGNKTISNAIEDHLRKKLQAKEKEYERVIQKGNEREKKLREKLEDALSKIRQFHEDVSREDDEKALAELDQLTSEWDQQKSQLDAKMAALQIIPPIQNQNSK